MGETAKRVSTRPTPGGWAARSEPLPRDRPLWRRSCPRGEEIGSARGDELCTRREDVVGRLCASRMVWDEAGGEAVARAMAPPPGHSRRGEAMDTP